MSEVRQLMEEEASETSRHSTTAVDLSLWIQFASNKRKYESDLFFSSSIDASGLASKIKNFDIIREAAERLRQLMLEVDF